MKKIFKIMAIMLIFSYLLFITSCKKEYSVTFKDYDGTLLKEEIVEEDQDATAPQNPKRDGYKFIGWSEEYINVQKDLVIIAQYEKEEIFYTVKFIDFDGTLLKEEKVKESFTATPPINPERFGYIFIGWDNTYTNIQQNTTIVALYKINETVIDTYTITFNTNSETIIENQYLEKGDKIKEPTPPTKLGYTFIGWYLDEKLWSFIGYSVAEDITLEAKWEINTYNITYELNGGYIYNPTRYTVDDKVTLNNPEKTGYTFIGWTTENNDTPSVNIIIENEIGDRYYYANYAPKTYKIILDVNGGDSLENIEVEYDSEFDLSDIIPTKSNRIFISWFYNNKKIIKGIYKYPSDITIKAIWNLEEFAENGMKYMYFGKYPQSLESNSSIISALNNISTTNSLGYIEYNGNEYKKATATPWINGNQYFGNEELIITGNTYYFKVEPIKWRILESNDGTYKLLSEMILDNAEFYNLVVVRTINGTKVYPNNYEYSNIRAWLNGYNGTCYNVDDYTKKGFIDIAFTDEEKAFINDTLVDNSASSTGDSSTICNNTTDKIYLLSYQDVRNIDYGFSSNYRERDSSRLAVVSDYARSKGCYANNYDTGNWWLRSPNTYLDCLAYYTHAVRVVKCDGKITSDEDYDYNKDYYADNDDNGVRVACTINLN